MKTIYILMEIWNVFNNKLLKSINDKILKMTYLKDDMEEVNLEGIIKNRKYSRRKIPDNKRCMGRKIDGLRCTRSKIINSDFCRSHIKSLPNGRIDDGKVFKKKISNKEKNKKYDNDNYICVYKKRIDNIIYFLDQENYVYINDIEHPNRIGKYNILDNKINYFMKNKSHIHIN